MSENKNLSQSNSNNHYAWFVFILSCCFVIFKYVLEISPSVMVKDLMHEFHLDGLHMGNLAACYFYAYFLMQIPVGLLVDRFSTRKIMFCAILLCSLGSFVFASSSVFYMAAIGRVIIGIGGAFSMVGTMKLITLWFDRKRFALISSLMMAAAMIGAICGQAPLSALVASVGWKHSMLYLSFFGVIFACVFYICIRDKKIELDVINKFDNKPSGSIFGLFLSIMKNPSSWLISLYSGLAFAPITAFAGLWGTPFLMEAYGLSKTTVAGLISLVFLGFAIGSPLAGWLFGKGYPRKKLMFLGTFLELIILIIIIYVPNQPILFLAAFMILFGFFTGFFFVSFASMQLINKQEASGTSIGFINMFNALCGALCDPLIGHFLDLGWDHKYAMGDVRVFSVYDYRVALLTLPIGLIIALVSLYFFKEK